MTWETGTDKDGKESEYFIQCNDFTITKAINVKLPYGLYRGNKNHGYFATSIEAKQKYESIKYDQLDGLDEQPTP
jgi:hypothetical protein